MLPAAWHITQMRGPTVAPFTIPAIALMARAIGIVSNWLRALDPADKASIDHAVLNENL